MGNIGIIYGSSYFGEETDYNFNLLQIWQTIDAAKQVHQCTSRTSPKII